MSEAQEPASAVQRAMTLEEAWRLVEAHRSAGRLDAAEALIQQILAARPDEARAFHELGIIAYQRGRLAQAILHVERAAALAPEVALFAVNLGEMYRLAGRPDLAIQQGERALRLQPDYADALNNVGVALYETGDYDGAMQSYQRALALKPDYAEARSNLGNALRALKRYEEALAQYRRATELRPQFADPWNNLATTLRDVKRYDEAETAYRRALALRPDAPETLRNLALCLRDLYRLDEAEAALRRVLAIEGDGTPTLIPLATVLLDRQRLEDAAEVLARALALDGDNADIHNLLGRLAFERNDPPGALAQYRRALALNPDHTDALNNLGNALKELGRLDEARAAYAAALALDPASAGVWVNYADALTFAAGDPRLAAMAALRQGATPLSDTDRLRLDFALAKAYADLGDQGRSFEHLRRGNRLRRAQIAYDEAAMMTFFDRIEAVFTPELMAEKARLGGDPSAVPIFVIGMPRSGTTLVEQILASHPQVFGAGELRTLDTAAGTGPGPQGPLPYPEFVPALDAAALTKIGAGYVAELRRLAPEAARITDKMPSNFYFAGLIPLALPNARIVHTVRDPVDTCLSCFAKLFAGEQHHTYDLGELGRYYRRYERLMAHWRRVLPPGTLLDVRYESVVADLEGEARRILAHCGLAWDEACLAFHRTERRVRTASATQVRQPLYQSAVGRGRAYAEFLGPLLEALAR
ncbi:MAG TPA: tetratricopeptide repeat protein [Stellaceae bacterium]|nr:tetratricopeptide repeat protein [Stellaceae bacterium]